MIIFNMKLPTPFLQDKLLNLRKHKCDTDTGQCHADISATIVQHDESKGPRDKTVKKMMDMDTAHVCPDSEIVCENAGNNRCQKCGCPKQFRRIQCVTALVS